MDVDNELLTLLAEQRRELTAAKALESDLDYAFQLQMQEAMKSSIALHSSSSSSLPSSSASPSHFQFQDDAVFDSDSGSGSSLAHILDEEIARFERERSDVEHVQAEIKRMQDDINRRIHDQAFARELLGVPEEQWRKTGEHFQKPYGEGSSKGVDNGERFSKLSAFRFACKFYHNSREKGEGKVSDCPITGKWIPMQSQVGTMVDQVTLLQRKFTQCSPSLVNQKDINFAFKLAREVLISQATRPAEHNRGKNMIENCVICLEDTDVDHMFSVNNCLHRYCFSCMKKHVEAKLHQGILPKCPHEGCKSEMKIESCQKFLTPELFHIMSQRIKEASIPPGEKIYCPYSKCSALMSKVEVQGYAVNLTGGGEQVAARQCAKCGGIFCISCKVPWHRNMNCYDYKRLNPYPAAEDAKLKNLAARNRWRQCVKCNHMVELSEGCYHIYCRCGYEFCYTCGAEWKNKKATCRCPIWDERNIVYEDRNNNRHQQLQRRG
ncbi:hypothetical protein LguiB_000947 [Lonicera macranthoides]